MDTHLATARAFQASEEAFVWGIRHDPDTDPSPWHLAPGRAHQDRELVKAHVRCPVPDCAALLTTVARPHGRDGLRHLADTGNHPGESLDHATACLAVDAWIRRVHPGADVRREVPTSDHARRADVLATNTSGVSVAVEIQYSPLTAEQWLARHNDYARHGVLDAWLWGHRGANITVDHEGRITPNAAQRAMLRHGMPLLFINPATSTVAIATAQARPLDEQGRPSADPVTILDVDQVASLEVHPLDHFRLSPIQAITSARLSELRHATAELHAHNDAVHAAIETTRAVAAEARAAAIELRRLEVAPAHARIRELLADIGPGNRWSTSAAHDAIYRYISAGRIRRIGTYQPRPGEPDRLIRWQAVLYFTLVAGSTASFTARTARDTIKAAGAKIGHPDALERIDSYCEFLAHLGYLAQQGPPHRRVYTPTPEGAWW